MNDLGYHITGVRMLFESLEAVENLYSGPALLNNGTTHHLITRTRNGQMQKSVRENDRLLIHF